MIRLIIILVSLLLLFQTANCQWASLNGPTGGFVLNTFVRDNELFACTVNGVYTSGITDSLWISPGIPFNSTQSDDPNKDRVNAIEDFNGDLYAAGRGFFKSTDKGQSWTKISVDLPDSVTLTGIQFAGTFVYAFEEFKYAYVSKDAGIHWTVLHPKATYAMTRWNEDVYLGSLGIFKIAAGKKPVAAGLPNTYITSLAFDGTTVLAGTYGNGLFTLIDTTWTANNVGIETTQLKRMSASQGKVYAIDYSNVLYRYDKAKWTNLSKNAAMTALTPQNVLYQDGILYLSASQGVFISKDGGDTWKPKNDGLTNTLVSKMAQVSDKLYGFSSYLKKEENPAALWYKGKWQKIPIAFTCLTQPSDYVAGSSSDGLYNSSDGLSWTKLKTNIVFTEVKDISILPGSKNLVIIADTTLYRSTTNLNTWEKIAFPISVTRIAEIKAVGNVLLAATNNGIYYSQNSGTTWVNASMYFKGKKSIFNCTKISGDQNTMYVATFTGVCYSKDAGLTWTFGGAPPSRFVITAIAAFKQVIFANTYEAGVFFSRDQGLTWIGASDGLMSLQQTRSLATDSKFLYLGSGSAGVWARPLSDFFPPAISLKDSVDIFANQAKIFASVASRGGYPATFSYQLSSDSNFINILQTNETNLKVSNDTGVAVSYVFTGLTENENYYARIVGANMDGATSFSNTVSFSTKRYIYVDTLKSVYPLSCDKSLPADSIPKIKIFLNQYVPGTKARFFYRPLTNNTWKDTLLQSSTSMFSIPIPKSYLGDLGLEYYFTILPAQGFSSGNYSDTVTSKKRIAIAYPRGLAIPGTLHTGPNRQDYNLLSFPLDLTDQQPAAMIKRAVGVDKPDDRVYRFLTYVGTGGNYKNIWSINPQQIEPGTGYWFAARKLTGTMQMDAGQTVVHNANFNGSNFSLKIHAGYNQIGNPYLFPVVWKDALASSDAGIGELIGFVKDGDSLRLKQVNTLGAYQAGYVYNSSSTASKTLRLPCVKPSGSLRTSANIPEISMQVDFVLVSGSCSYEIAALGTSQYAEDSVHALNVPLPPMPSEFPQLYFKGKAPMAKHFLAPNERGNQWEFYTTGIDEKGNAELKWNATTEPGKLLWIQDVDQKFIVNMHSQNALQLKGNHHYKVLYGQAAYLDEALNTTAPLVNFFPNPVSGQLNLSLFLPATAEPETYKVRTVIYNLEGNMAEAFQDTQLSPGLHHLSHPVLEKHTGLKIVSTDIINSKDQITRHTKKMVFVAD